MASDAEMEMYRRLSNGYEHDVTGPLVSQRLPTQALVVEYANADPIYVIKTKGLAEKFPYYRTLRGDGNCGWRALAFGYFETLLRLGDPSRIRGEMSRLQGFNALINLIGYEEYLYLEFVQQTLDLLEEAAKYLSCQGNGPSLLDRFNDDAVSNAIITHFRLITSGWMKSQAHLYKDFLLDMTIDQYRAAYIDPFQVEIEHLGVQACIDAILKPCGIAVDVQYLDRSDCGEANTINCWPDGLLNGQPTTATLTLLYRPGHYDILYANSMNANDMNVGVWYLREEGDIPMYSNNTFGSVMYGDIDLSAIPGFSVVRPNPMPQPVYTPSHEFGNDSYPAIDVPIDPVPTKPLQAPMDPFHPLGHNSNGASNVFRLTKYQYEMDYQGASSHLEPCRTEAMKQAGESIAHYKNKEFQPFIWAPGSD